MIDKNIFSCFNFLKNVNIYKKDLEDICYACDLLLNHKSKDFEGVKGYAICYTDHKSNDFKFDYIYSATLNSFLIEKLKNETDFIHFHDINEFKN